MRRRIKRCASDAHLLVLKKDGAFQALDKEIVIYTTEMILWNIFLTYHGTEVFDQAERKSQKIHVQEVLTILDFAEQRYT